MDMQFHATTICAVRHNGKGAIAGDGQVTFGNSMVMKHHGQESEAPVPRPSRRRVCGLGRGCDYVVREIRRQAGRTSRQFAARRRRAGQRLALRPRAAQAGSDDDRDGCERACCLFPADGEIIEPDDGILAIGSGGSFALAAARASEQSCASSGGERYGQVGSGDRRRYLRIYEPEYYCRRNRIG